MTRQYNVRTVGADPVPGIPPEDYADFANLAQCLYEVRFTLSKGNFPPGLILSDGHTRAKVVGDYGTHQQLQRL